MTKRIAIALSSAVLLVGSLFLGGEPLSFAELSLPGSPSHRILFDLRLPRMILALVAGGSLAMLGGAYQILFHNPLAEPYILGVSSAVTLGVALGEIFFHFAPLTYWGSVLGLALAMALTGILIALWRSGQAEGLGRLILFGMGANFVLSSLLFLIISYSSQTTGGGNLRWLFGEIPWVTGKEALLFAAIAAPFLLLLFVQGRALDALSLGDPVARTLGIEPVRARNVLLGVTSAFVALIVAFTGTIGFVGLVVPHSIRLILRPGSTRELFVFSFLVGAVFLVLCDVLARAIVPPLEFPIGILTTLVGGPIFLLLLWRRSR